jgi:hypothetical protein
VFGFAFLLVGVFRFVAAGHDRLLFGRREKLKRRKIDADGERPMALRLHSSEA